MPIAFAVCFVLIAGLSEVLRQGVFGLGPVEIAAMVYGAFALAAAFILRTDIIAIFRPSENGLYGHARLGWTWRRTMTGLVLAPLLCLVPLGFAAATGQTPALPDRLEPLAVAFFTQSLLPALCAELFFREAAVKSFGDSTAAMVIASCLAWFTFCLPQGLEPALIAAGTGLWLLTLRLIGTNILAVAAIHAALVVAFDGVIPLDLGGMEIRVYAICFTVGAAILSFTVLAFMTRDGKELRYA